MNVWIVCPYCGHGNWYTMIPMSILSGMEFVCNCGKDFVLMSVKKDDNES